MIWAAGGGEGDIVYTHGKWDRGYGFSSGVMEEVDDGGMDILDSKSI